PWRKIGAPPNDKAVWLAVPRSRVGQPLDVTRMGDGLSADTIPAFTRALTADDWGSDAEVIPVRRAGAVVIPAIDGGALITVPPCQELDGLGHPFYWEGDFDPSGLHEGEILSQRFVRVNGDVGVYVRMTLRQGAGAIAGSYFAPGDL